MRTGKRGRNWAGFGFRNSLDVFFVLISLNMLETEMEKYYFKIKNYLSFSNFKIQRFDIFKVSIFKILSFKNFDLFSGKSHNKSTHNKYSFLPIPNTLRMSAAVKFGSVS